MSGTSLDGLDIALCEISGNGTNTVVDLRFFETCSYSTEFKNEIRSVFAKEVVDFQHLAILNEWIACQHADLILNCLRKWNINPNQVDLIASHGQTVMHAPKILHQKNNFPNATLQIGDGDHIAVNTGIITVSDFRQKHLAAGGEGAPLAVYGDYFLCANSQENRILLNLGGIGNFTILPNTKDNNFVFVTDSGPGNTLIDAFVKLHFPNLDYDDEARLAKKGTCNQLLLQELKKHSFFQNFEPKTTGPELFNIEFVNAAMQTASTLHLKTEDILATLTRFSAETIADNINYQLQKINFHPSDFTVYVSGGGVHNPLLMSYLKELIPSTFMKTDDLGIHSDAKEALLFAVLANETVAGSHTNMQAFKEIPAVCMGKISFPN